MMHATRTWLRALVLIVVLLGGWELFWRSRGWSPSIEGNEESWILARSLVGPSSTVIAGTSRIQAALDPRVWSVATGEKPPIQLAIAATSPVPVLEAMAADSSYHGLFVMELLPFYAFEANLGSERETRKFLDAYERSRASPAMRWEAFLRTHIPNHFVFRRAKLLPHRIYASWRAHDLDPPQSFQREDRYHPIAFSDDALRRQAVRLADTIRFQGLIGAAQPARGEALDRIHSRIRSSALRIIARGGRVAIVHLQACGARRFAEDRVMPAAMYWARLAAIPGILTIDSDDVPAIARLQCRDGSHVDARDAPLVTRKLASLIIKQAN